MASASGACPSVISVTISRLSTYSVSGCSPAIAVGTISPRSLYASTSKVAGRAALVSCGRCLATDVGHLYFLGFRGGLGSNFRIAIRPSLPDRGDLVANFLVRGAAAHERLQVVARLREEAREERALGRQPHPRAAGAEGLRDRRDDADLAGAVGVAPALGDFARVVGADRLERPALGDAPYDLGRGYDVVHAPAVRAADVHVLDEARDVSARAPALGHRQDVAVVDAALHHHVDLHRRKAGRGRGVDALEHFRHREIDVVHGAEGGLVERVQAD